MRMAEDFQTFVAVPFEVTDVIITGGNVNYNYTSHSDIDLHLIADFDSITCDREVAELFDTKRLLYRRRYDLTIHDVPVELYVEDQRIPAVSAGLFSVRHNRWLRKPQQQQVQHDQAAVEHWTGIWTTVLQAAMRTGDLQVCRNAVNLLRSYRKLGLSTNSGEFSIPNLVFKSLRNDSVIQGITVLIDRLHDQELSI
jgi:hypothetical protein